MRQLIRKRAAGFIYQPPKLPSSGPMAAFKYPVPLGVQEELPTGKRVSVNFPRAEDQAWPAGPIIAQKWTPIEQRSGMLALKKGMMSLWDPWGQYIPVTVLQLPDHFVLANKSKEKDGYDAVMVGCGRTEIKELADVERYRIAIGASRRAQLGFCVEHVAEFRVTPSGQLPVRAQLNATHFVPGQFIDIQSRSRDKGFQGVMKRWGFKGQSATHGTSRAHRSPGSIGQRKTPGKVWKGKKMAGHKGNKMVTVHSLQIIKIDRVLNLLYVKGTVPGPRDALVRVKDALRKVDQFNPYVNPPPFPTRLPEEVNALPQEIAWSPAKDEEDPIAKRYHLNDS